MKVEIPELTHLQKDLAKALTILKRLEELERKDRFIPKKEFMDQYQVSSTACSNYENEGYLIAYKLKGKVFYKESNIIETLESGLVKD